MITFLQLVPFPNLHAQSCRLLWQLSGKYSSLLESNRDTGREPISLWRKSGKRKKGSGKEVRKGGHGRWRAKTANLVLQADKNFI